MPVRPLGLTTIRQPIRLKGELAAAALLDMTDGQAPALPVKLPTELVIRTSTAQPSARS